MKDLILVGIQGSGKGTQGTLLAKNYGYQIFVTGDELRRIAQEDSSLGSEVKAITERGDLVSNEVVMRIVENFLESLETDTPVIFDGIPRSEEQRQTLEALLQKFGRDFQVLELTLSESTAFDRLMKRAEIEGRADDNPDSIRKRIANFHTHTAPLLSVWESQGRLFSADGEQDITEGFAQIVDVLELDNN